MFSAKLYRSLILATACIAAVLTSVSVYAAEEKKGQDAALEVAAFVNGQPIVMRDVNGETNGILQQYYQQGQMPSEDELVNIRQSALQKLIDLELLFQDSKKVGFTVEPAVIDMQLSKFKKQFGNEESYLKALSTLSMSEEDLRMQFSKNLIIQEFIDQKIKPAVTVSEKETSAFYNSNKEKFVQPEQVRARHILIMAKETDSAADKERKREKLVKIKKQIEGGEDFAAMAKRFSEGPSNVKGGDLGYFSRGQMVKPFEKAAFAMMPGDVSDVVETEFGYHLIKLEDKKFAKTVSYDETKGQISNYISQQKVNELVMARLEELKKSAEIKVVMQ